MLSRSSSSARGRLRRAKSTSSVSSPQEAPPLPPIDRGTRYHALTAASIAMQRANQRSSGQSYESTPARDPNPCAAQRYQPQPRSIRFSDNDGAQSPSSQCPGIAISRDHVPNEDYQIGDSEATYQLSEFGATLEENIPSAPSSYRRLRRAKSMFSTRPRAAGSVETSRSPRRYRESTDGNDSGHLSKATLRRSKSFFRRGSQQVSQQYRQQPQDAAVQLARDQFLQNMAQQAKIDDAESLYARKQRQVTRPFRKSLRSTSGMSTQSGISSGNQVTPKGRSFSFSIKKGLRRIFGRSSTSQQEPDNASTQREGGHGTQFSDYVDSEVHDGEDKMLGNQGQESHSMYGDYSANFSGRPASVRTMKSTDSFSIASSRITSWANSTATNTLAARPVTSEGNRLSVIDELNDPREACPSALSLHYNDGYSVFRQPLQIITGGNSSDTTIDSHRVYSALRRRINESSSESHHDGEVTPRAASPVSVVGDRNSSACSHRTGHTIRHVAGEVSAGPGATVLVSRKRPASIRSQSTLRSNYPGGAPGLTPQQVANYNEAMESRRSRGPLRESKSSLFFGGGKAYGGSPCRSVRTPTRFPFTNSDDDSGSVIVSRPTTNRQCPTSPSIYSRTTSGGSPLWHRSPTNRTFSESGDERGTVTILASHRLPYRPSCSPNNGVGDRRIKGSAEWKSWMNSQLDSIDAAATARDTLETPPGKVVSHYRENAQICDDVFKEDEGEPTLEVDQNMQAPTGSKTASLDLAPRPPLTEIQRCPQSNFSMPLRMSPDLPICVSQTVVRKPSFVTGLHTPLSVRITREALPSPTPSPGSLRSRSASATPGNSPLVYRKSRHPDKREPLASPPVNATLPNSAEAHRNRYARYSPNVRAVEFKKQAQAARVGSARSRRDNGGVNNENTRNIPDLSRWGDTEGGVPKLEDIHSTISSKRMVDIFLSDRRRQMATSEESNYEPAFL
ncbi:hypothetical protein AJ80_08365 [Polytolypa hystricis UAMH7299]|uniref:Uncharacterized protein n=1 Tax=Polytolypa hystricis (strain UAMH7299) TaxID=1447883 RepID=A0A2B7X967_POLH7|nr:hypothetical protein AJ80_08365 [Polytolypa hystricis UAMH7299]